MIRLALIRHAKSDWGDPELDDHDRPLASAASATPLAWPGGSPSPASAPT